MKSKFLLCSQSFFGLKHLNVDRSEMMRGSDSLTAGEGDVLEIFFEWWMWCFDSALNEIWLNDWVHWILPYAALIHKVFKQVICLHQGQVSMEWKHKEVSNHSNSKVSYENRIILWRHQGDKRCTVGATTIILHSESQWHYWSVKYEALWFVRGIEQNSLFVV